MQGEIHTCQRECVKQSKFSPDPPGVVENSESIGRLIIAPEHVDEETGEIKTAAFKKEQLAGDGLSVARLSFATKEELKAVGEDLAGRRAETKFCGLIQAEVREIRRLNSDGARIFCVLDDGLEEFYSHALVLSSKSCRINVRKARLELKNLFSALRSVEDALGE